MNYIVALGAVFAALLVFGPLFTRSSAAAGAGDEDCPQNEKALTAEEEAPYQSDVLFRDNMERYREDDQRDNRVHDPSSDESGWS